MKTNSQLPNREFILDTLSHCLCTVTFDKLDGTERTMKCTRNSSFIPSEFHPKGEKLIKENTEIVSAYDIDAKGWRSFTVKNVTHFNLV
jgi:hypothetical protein